MTTATELHTKAVEVDTAIADAYEAEFTARRNRDWANDSLRHRLGHRGGWNGFSTISHSDLMKEAAESTDPRIEHALDGYLTARTTLIEATKALAEANDKYEGWSRFFLVTNNNGHIHSSMNCRTCFHDTAFNWLPTLSGLTEADAVAEHGEILCSVCFPTAPVEWTNGTSNKDKAAKAKRAAEKAAREEARLAKALLPNGAPLRLRDEDIKTLATAKKWLTDAYRWGVGHPSYKIDEVTLVAEAVAAKTGETVETVLAAAKKRAAK